MDNLTQTLLTELCHVIGDLGKDGGQMSPSIYDTAQLLRYCLSHDTPAVVDWLPAQQRRRRLGAIHVFRLLGLCRRWRRCWRSSPILLRATPIGRGG